MTHCGPASREVIIKTNYGEISGKEWNWQSGSRIDNVSCLALHGWLNNAGSFDPVVRYIPNNYHVVAFDFAGHGRTSHLGRGALYTPEIFVMDVVTVIEHFKWQNFFILAHSMGARVAFRYSSLFPDRVLGIISLDVLYPGIHKQATGPDYVRKLIGNQRTLEEREFGPILWYTFDEAVARLRKNQRPNADLDAMIERSLNISSDGKRASFARDYRLKVRIEFNPPALSPGLTEEQLKGLNILCIMGSEGLSRTRQWNSLDEVMGLYGSIIKVIELEGSHFLHLERAQVVANIIDQFIAEIDRSRVRIGKGFGNNKETIDAEEEDIYKLIDVGIREVEDFNVVNLTGEPRQFSGVKAKSKL